MSQGSESGATPAVVPSVAPSQGTWGLRLDPLLWPLRRFLARHEKKLWWAHSAYALSLGVLVVLFAREGFSRARMLPVSLGGAWLLLLVLFRVVSRLRGTVETDSTRARASFFAMTYALRNLYQGMHFFALPFYWQSASLDARNRYFVLLLGVCALLSTLDLVFDRVLMRFRAAAAGLYAFILFACLSLVLPAALRSWPTRNTMLLSAALAMAAFWSLHVPLRWFRKRWLWPLGLTVLTAAGTAGAWYAREWVPPVPLYLGAAAVGPSERADGSLMMDVRSLHAEALHQLVAVTDVVSPTGHADVLRHVWRQRGRVVHRFLEPTASTTVSAGTVRLRSTLPREQVPAHPEGEWSVDVETEDGRLVGRARFTVVP